MWAANENVFSKLQHPKSLSHPNCCFLGAHPKSLVGGFVHITFIFHRYSWDDSQQFTTILFIYDKLQTSIIRKCSVETLI